MQWAKLGGTANIPGTVDGDICANSLVSILCSCETLSLVLLGVNYISPPEGGFSVSTLLHLRAANVVVFLLLYTYIYGHPPP